MKKQLLVLMMGLALLSSCSEQTFYQVYQVESVDVSQKGKMLFFENEDCTITYNLWAKGGDISFLMHNKTNENMYIVMPQSFFILNGIAHNYYSESTYGKTVTGIAALSSSRQITLSGYLNTAFSWYPTTISRQASAMTGVSTSKSIQTKEPMYICIPPKSAKYIYGFNISDYVYKDCDNHDQNYPKISSNEVRYTQDNSPLKFRNRIAYTLGKEDAKTEFIDHHFWVSSFQNYSDKGAFSKEEIKDCESGSKSKERYFKMYSPLKFYNEYKGNPYAKNTWGKKKTSFD